MNWRVVVGTVSNTSSPDTFFLSSVTIDSSRKSCSAWLVRNLVTFNASGERIY
jgi:hypothetical protein